MNRHSLGSEFPFTPERATELLRRAPLRLEELIMSQTSCRVLSITDLSCPLIQKSTSFHLRKSVNKFAFATIYSPSTALALIHTLIRTFPMCVSFLGHCLNHLSPPSASTCPSPPVSFPLFPAVSSRRGETSSEICCSARRNIRTKDFPQRRLCKGALSRIIPMQASAGC